MLKEITPLGTTIKERASPGAGQKSMRRRNDKDKHDQTQAEILELSPLARFMSGFRRHHYRYETKDGYFSFALELWAQNYKALLKGCLNLHEHTWNISWEMAVHAHGHSDKDNPAALMEQFVKEAGAHQKEEKDILTLVLQGRQGIESMLHFEKSLVEVLRHLLMQVVVLSDLPDPTAGKNRPGIFNTGGDDYQVLRGKSSFYFPWPGMQQLHIKIEQ